MNVVEFRDVSKKFVLHHQKARSFQGALVGLFRRGASETFWALRDVSFSVQRGESLGIIGQNGSGKSTSLKLISRILEPTSGTVTVNGKVSALLELGAGFHPELTGRENIYLNGSILGLPRKRIREKFEEIVAFSELERFIDTPIKHYSSGMYVRLGFAVAVTLDSDILIVDEVLAVGDEAFREKCMRKIRQFHEEGRTILFVAHVSNVVEEICDRVVLLDDGCVVGEGDPVDMLDLYHKTLALHADKGLRTAGWTDQQEHGPGQASAGLPGIMQPPVTVEEVRLLDQDGHPRTVINSGENVALSIRYRVNAPGAVPAFRVGLYRQSGVLVHRTVSSRMGLEIPALAGGGEVRLHYHPLPLVKGGYYVDVDSVDPGDPIVGIRDKKASALTFQVETPVRVGGGIVALPHTWTTEHDGNGVKKHSEATAQDLVLS